MHYHELNLWKDFGTRRVAHRLGFGMEYRERETEEYRDGLSTDLATGEQTNVLLGEVFPLRDFPITTTREFGAYLEDTMNFGDWTVIAALRADAPTLVDEAAAPEPVERRMTVRRGDTLSEIAERYNVSMSAIRSVNKLSSNRLRIGQTLRIPVFAGT